MKSGYTFKYKSDNPASNDRSKLMIKQNVSDDVNLEQLFAEFVNFTEMVGFNPDSWYTIINGAVKEVERIETPGDYRYTLFDWARDVMCDMAIN